MRATYAAAAGLLLAFAGCAAPTGPTPTAAPPGTEAAPPAAPPRDRPAEPASRAEHPGSAYPVSAWAEGVDGADAARLRAALTGPDEEAALVAAINLPPSTLSLAEIRRQAALVVKHAHRCFPWAGRADGFWRCPGLDSIGSPEVMALYRLAVDRDRDGTLDAPPEDLHRVTIQDHLPALAALLGPARGEVFQRLYGNFRLLADNTDRHHEVVERALLQVRADLLSEKLRRPVSPLEDRRAAAPGSGIPESLRLLVLAPWGMGDRDIQEAFFVPPSWIERWFASLRLGPADLPFLRTVAQDALQDGLHETQRTHAMRAIEAIGGHEAERILKELEESGWKVRERMAEEQEQQPAPAPAPEALSPAAARERVDAWTRDPGSPERLRTDAGWREIVLAEAAAPEAFDALPGTWARSADEETREQSAAMRIRRGDTGSVGDLLALDGSSVTDYWRIGRCRDPRVRERLERNLRAGTFDHGRSLAALALWHGLPEALAESLIGVAPAKSEEDPVARATVLVLEGRPADAALLLAEADRIPEDRIARLGLLGEKARTILERRRAERDRGLYWPATAGLAMAGDAAAREEFLSLLKDDRICLWDDWFDPVACTLNGDPEALAYWRSRVGSNCCLWFYAEEALGRWYPTMPRAVSRVGDPGGNEEKVRRWWERWKDRLRWSRLADGWVPVDE